MLFRTIKLLGSDITVDTSESAKDRLHIQHMHKMQINNRDKNLIIRIYLPFVFCKEPLMKLNIFSGALTVVLPKLLSQSP